MHFDEFFQAYSSYALDFPNRLKIVGAADPFKHRTIRIQKVTYMDQRKTFNTC